MAKKCVICEAPAEFKIKDSLDFYCRECAQESFSDLKLLLEVNEEVTRLKAAIDQRMTELESEQEADGNEEVDDAME
jgi:hypothetical protein